MTTTITILILTIAVSLIALSQFRRKPFRPTTSKLPELRQFDGLFAEERAKEMELQTQAEERQRLDEWRKQLLSRAAEGDESVLDEAHESGELQLYQAALQALILHANGNAEQLQSLAEYIVDGGSLRSTSELAKTMIGLWSKSLNYRSLTDMLYLAALADDPEVFQQALDAGLKQWRAGKLPRVSAKDFFATVECAYWLIAGEVRTSGKGFQLKQMIAAARQLIIDN